MSKVQVIVQKIPILQACCCGCTLYTGTMIITILNLVGALGGFIATCAIAAGLEIVRDHLDDDKLHDLSSKSKDLINGLYSLFVFFTILYLGVIIVSSLAIHGSRTRKRRLLLPWLWFVVIKEAINLILSIVMLAKAQDYSNALKDLQEELISGTSSTSASSYTPHEMYSSIITHALWLVIELGLAIYFFLVVHSFYVELGNPPVPQAAYPGAFPGGNPTIVVPPGANIVYAGPPAGAMGFGPSGDQVNMDEPPAYGKLSIN